MREREREGESEKSFTKKKNLKSLTEWSTIFIPLVCLKILIRVP